MEIEKEIQQSHFVSEHQKVSLNILFTASWLGSQIDKVLKKYGLTQQQFNILRILRGQKGKPATVNLLIERMIDKQSNASRIVERLRIKGLLERSTCPEDRRAVNVIITKKGLDLLAQIDIEQDSFEAPLKALSEQEAKKLNGLLNKLRS